MLSNATRWSRVFGVVFFRGEKSCLQLLVDLNKFCPFISSWSSQLHLQMDLHRSCPLLSSGGTYTSSVQPWHPKPWVPFLFSQVSAQLLWILSWLKWTEPEIKTAPKKQGKRKDKGTPFYAHVCTHNRACTHKHTHAHAHTQMHAITQGKHLEQILLLTQVNTSHGGWPQWPLNSTALKRNRVPTGTEVLHCTWCFSGEHGFQVQENVYVFKLCLIGFHPNGLLVHLLGLKLKANKSTLYVI